MSNLYKDNHPISSTKNAPTVNTKIEASAHQKKNRGFAQETEVFFILFLSQKKKKEKKRSSHSKIASHIHKEK